MEIVGAFNCQCTLYIHYFFTVCRAIIGTLSIRPILVDILIIKRNWIDVLDLTKAVRWPDQE